MGSFCLMSGVNEHCCTLLTFWTVVEQTSAFLNVRTRLVNCDDATRTLFRPSDLDTVCPPLDRAKFQLQLSQAATCAPAEYDPGQTLQVGRIQRYAFKRFDLRIAGLDPALNGFRLLHIADVHLMPDRWPPGLDAVIERVQNDPPDLVCLTGDLIDDKNDPRPVLPLAERLMTQLTSRLGTAAVLGNHDGDLLGPHLASWGVRLIERERVLLDAGKNARVELLGLSGVHRDDHFPQMLLSQWPGRTPGVPRIVLSHYPDALPRVMRLSADVYLAGHTHGGQICLPGGIPVITHDDLPRRFSSGVHRIGDTYLCVSRGMGFTAQPIRTFCPAEVIELRLTRGLLACP